MSDLHPTDSGSLCFKADIEISSDVRFLALVRSLIEGLALELGWPAAESRKIKLAVDEAITNKIRHAYSSRPDAQIRMEITTVAHGLVLRLTDRGARPDDAKLCAREQDSSASGGMGTHIIRDVMDEVVYETIGDSNLLTMTKYLPGRKTAKECTE